MYPARFEYHAPTSVEEALSILDRYGDEAKVIAGGQSLIPLMKLRFASPVALVDINRIAGLDSIEEKDGFSPSARSCATRTASTPSSCAVATASWATRRPSSPTRSCATAARSPARSSTPTPRATGARCSSPPARRSGPQLQRLALDPAQRAVLGPFQTRLEPTELAVAVKVPDPGQKAGGTYLKLERKVGDYATAGVAVHLSMDNGKVGRAGIALTGVGPSNLRATAAEESLAGATLNEDTIKAAAELAAEAAQPRSDNRGSAEYKRSVVRVFTERGLRKAAETAQA